MKKKIFAFTLFFLAFVSFSQAEIEIHLKKSFIEAYKLRATIEIDDFFIDKAHERPNPPSKDGDLHIAGRSSTIGLPVVAEIMNAKYFQKGVDFVHKHEGSNVPVKMTGIWRIWCEHAGEDKQIQGKKVEKIATTNPKHVFEIHPVTKLGDMNLGDSLVPIDGYTYKVCQDSFLRFENTPCRIIPNGDSVIIETRGVGYNYVEFKIQLRDDEKIEESDDGYFVICKVLDLDDEIVSQKTRIVFAKNTKPASYVDDLKNKKTLRVVGITRMNLSLISWRLKESNNNPRVLDWNLPLEMVIVAVVDE
jgi:hypothetical protein